MAPRNSSGQAAKTPSRKGLRKSNRADNNFFATLRLCEKKNPPWRIGGLSANMWVSLELTEL
jgi:hypothetical protein